MSEISDNSKRYSEQYSLTAIALHWLMALLIIGMLLLGYYMVDLPKGTPNRADYFNLHKSFGVLAGILILLRVYWRLTHPVLPIQGDTPRWTDKLATWAQRLLYGCMILQPASGYLSSSFNKYGVKFFGVALPNWGWEDAPLRSLFNSFHYLIAMLFIALIVLHVLGALKHLLVQRDGVFQRMLPAGRN